MEKIFSITVVTALALSVLLVVFVFATGSTFGQRCSAMEAYENFIGQDHLNLYIEGRE